MDTITRLRSGAWALLGVLALSGCAGTQQTAGPVEPEQVSVYQSATAAPKGFQPVKRYWADSWISAFRIPTYDSQQEALASFRSRAGALGARGIIDLGCYRLDRRGETEPATLACNALAITY